MSALVLLGLAVGCEESGSAVDGGIDAPSADSSSGDASDANPADANAADANTPDANDSADADSDIRDAGPVDVRVTVDAESPGVNCDHVSLEGVVADWRDVFTHSDWPGSHSNVLGVKIPTPGMNDGLAGPNDAYLALAFDTRDVVDDGLMVSIGNTMAGGARRGTISRCPGDFTSAVPDSCRHIWGIGGGIHWSTRSEPATRECALDPNATYYLNLTFTDGMDPASPGCTIPPSCPTCRNCSTTLAHTNRRE